MDRNFSRALAAVLKHEGGFVDNAKDPGGPTNLGVTLENFRRFVKPDGTVDDLKKLTIEQAGVVFRRHYWDPVMGSALPDGVDFAVFDFAVNSGPARAAKYLQNALGVKSDGVIGDKTIKAAKDANARLVINTISDARMTFLRGLGTFSTFGKGWSRRVEEVRSLALDMAAQQPEAQRVVVEQVKVEVPVEKSVPAVPKGAEKMGAARMLAVVPLLGTPIAAFGSVDNVTKAVIAIAIVLAILALALRGEQIAARAKTILRSFEE